MPWNKDGSRKESTLYKKSNFKLRSGNDASARKVVMGNDDTVDMETDSTALSPEQFLRKYGITIAEYKTEQGKK